MRHPGTTAAALALTALVSSSTAIARPSAPPPSLCTAGETPLFTCPIGSKLVSVCGQPGGRSAYRYGRAGKPELQSQALTLADRLYSGGGETQVSFENRGYRYIVFAKTVRTGFGAGGQNDPDSIAGLAVRKGGRTVSTLTCGGTGDQTIDTAASRYMAKGAFIEH